MSVTAHRLTAQACDVAAQAALLVIIANNSAEYDRKAEDYAVRAASHAADAQCELMYCLRAVRHNDMAWAMDTLKRVQEQRDEANEMAWLAMAAAQGCDPNEILPPPNELAALYMLVSQIQEASQ